MARDPNVPDAFDVYTVVILRRPTGAPEMAEFDLDALQARHLAYRAELRQRGVLVANGPVGDPSDPAYRGMSSDARRLKFPRLAFHCFHCM